MNAKTAKLDVNMESTDDNLQFQCRQINESSIEQDDSNSSDTDLLSSCHESQFNDT